MIKNSCLYYTIMVIITNSKGDSELIPITKNKIAEGIFLLSNK
ncbi:PTS lactose transporter subunit IIC [Enterococcus faecalis]|nr:PTS lactose transporter subunit IIC [Enterococcus faecalis]